MTNEQSYALHQALLNAAYEQKITNSELLSWLTVTLIGSLKINGYSQEFVDKVLARMKEAFKSFEPKGNPLWKEALKEEENKAHEEVYAP